jgi:hypothetical protein
MGFVLKERLKGLKGVSRSGAAFPMGWQMKKNKRLTNDTMTLDVKSEIFGLVDEEVVERKKLFDELWNTLKSIDAMTFQHSRSKWLKEEDTNSSYFHNCIKARNRRNKMVALKALIGWIEGSIQVREEVMFY